ncbi:DUF1254 domain-containing protein [Flavihumibacter fluvii]|uniref:DUF1254 domain-containing protein n=1 Tax=Flavihumibacter fluvii TaxID=2838157 RepID=UPI001BDE8190|nr:DUF1254 domain-containing protein [Flavihumibacter fluvii]ULQ52123.1 DUF1254 domain-containing protein [Flavihumibacter fluvii]
MEKMNLLGLKRTSTIFVLTLLLFSACKTKGKNEAASSDALTPAEAREITRIAYTYAFPVIDNLRVQYAFFVDTSNPEYKAPYNQVFNIPRVFTPGDKVIQTPNSDTPYSWVGLDLRSEPLVFIIPPIEKERYWSLQLIDLYTHNFDYLGSRATGNGGGSFMIAGPGWNGETPKGITKVIRCETAIASAQFRTQLFNPSDLENVKKIQNQYIVKPLSAFIGQAPPAPAPAIDFMVPLTKVEQRTSLDIFKHLNFALQFCPTHPSEKELMAKFKKIGIGSGEVFDTSKFSPEIVQAMHAGIADAWKDFAKVMQATNEGKISPADAFGTREYLNGNYAYRMAAAVAGIYGNSKEEAIYPNYYLDADGHKLNGVNRYIMHFPPGQFPPANSFWSLTMYDSTDLLVANPINRYLLNSTMLSQFKRDKDGGLTLYIQHDAPEKTKTANWLPAPKGIFRMVLRLYWPKKEALDGTWKQPKVQKVVA